MQNTIVRSVLKFGKWSAIWSSIFSLTYIIGQLAEWFGLLGSAGGPESASTVTGIVILLTPSLFLGVSFLVLMVSIYHYSPPDRKIWGHTGLAFAVIYTALISINYFVQLTLVAPRMMRGNVEDIRFLLFIPFDSFLYSVDILGYSFMSLATLFAAFVFTGTRIEKTARFFLVANGLVLPFIALQNYYHPLIWIASLWAVTFPGATITLAILFDRKSREIAR